MAVPAKRIPESVAHLDVEIVAAALIRNDANVRNAARALDVPSGDLRKLVLIDQRLADAALEAIELRLDDAESNLCEALRCDDPRRRDAISMFMLRNMQRASKRGYAVAASAASLEVNVDAPPVRYTIRWMNERDSESSPESETEDVERDGRIIPMPRYDDGRRDNDDVVEGELAPPATMIGHETAAIDEPEPAVVEAIEPVPPPLAPESAAARYERERVAAWVRARLTPYPVDRCCHCRLPFNVGQQWQEVANDPVRARFHAACYAEWRDEREAAARQALRLAG